MNTFQCATSLKHWTKHMATMESAAHEVTFNMISHGRLKADLPSTGVRTLLCAGRRSTLRKPLRLWTPHKRLLGVKGCAQVHWKWDTHTQKNEPQGRESVLRAAFVPCPQGTGRSHPQGVLRDSWVTPRAPLFRWDFSAPLASIHWHGSPLWRGERASSITDMEGVNSTSSLQLERLLLWAGGSAGRVMKSKREPNDAFLC